MCTTEGMDMKRILAAGCIGLSAAVCCAGGQAAVPLYEHTGKTYVELCRELGAPVDKTAYEVKDAPQDGWNRKAVDTRYPNPEEYPDEIIMDVTWDGGDCFIAACFYLDGGENRCFAAARMPKSVAVNR